jgi:hypothetical protein
VTVTRDRSVLCGNTAAPLFRLLSVFWCDGDVLFSCSCLFLLGVVFRVNRVPESRISHLSFAREWGRVGEEYKTLYQITAFTVVERGVDEGVRGPTLPPNPSVEETESPRSSLVRVDTSTHKDCLLDKYPSAPRRGLRLTRRPSTKAVPYVYMSFPKR